MNSIGNKHMNYTRVFLVLSLLLPISSWATQKDWKILKNKYGWTIEYPKDWMLDEDFDTHRDYKLSPPMNGDFDAKDEFSPEICGPSKALMNGEQAGCVQISFSP